MAGSESAKNRKKFTLYCFFKNKMHFCPILVNTKTTSPPQGRCLALDIYLDASCLGCIHHYSPPLGIVVKHNLYFQINDNLFFISLFL